MVTVGVHEAKQRLSELIRLVRDGDTIVITHQGYPVAQLVRYEKPEKPS